MKRDYGLKKVIIITGARLQFVRAGVLSRTIVKQCAYSHA